MERLNCEFFLVRYVPDAVKNEFVNIGVLLREAGKPQQLQVRFTRDWQRVRAVDPEADTGMLESLEDELRNRLFERIDGARPLMEVLKDSFSNAIQVTEAKACLAESLPAELDQLMRMYVEPKKIKKAVRRSGRSAIQAVMRTQFERAGVWDLLRKRIAAATYTRPGDPLRIDCGYRPNGIVRMFHAVSLDGDIEMAKVLAFSAPALTDGIARVENAKLELTAIVEPLQELQKHAQQQERLEQYRFAIETMEQQSIRVLTTNDMPRVAETARLELHV
jgi:DNA repair exonuclease SbcCD ATPase subunit